MKTLKTLIALPCLLAAQSAFCQTPAHLTLSDQYPAPGEKITLSYDSTGTAIAGKKNLTAVVYYLDNKDYPAADITLKPDGQTLKGEISVPETAKAFYIRFGSDDGSVDNNNDKGYVYLVYKDKQPVPGAYASEGYMLASGMGTNFAKIKKDDKTGMDLFKKEFATYPQSEKEYQNTYYSMASRNPDYKDVIVQKIAVLEKSTDEKDLMLAISLLKATKNAKGADSLNAVIRAKFPDGTMVKNELGTAFYREKDLVKKDSLYNVYITRYPETPGEKNPVQDNFRVQLASAYLDKGDMDNFHKYEALIEDKSNLAGVFNNAAYEWAKKGEHLDEAAKLSKQSLDILTEDMKKSEGGMYRSPTQMKKSYAYEYDLYADTYALILYKEKKYKEALKYEQPVIDHSTTVDGEIYEHYVEILTGKGDYAKAQEFAEKSLKAGQGTDVTKEELKKDYVKLKGSDNGFEAYLAALDVAAQIKEKAELAKTMINQPAPVFALKDFDGKTVSLSDLKGKVVIVDFWATWCGPCKASFPGMQMAVNKFKDDPNVKFLFVDCWETDENYTDGVKKFIADNKYTFHVLLDEKGTDGRQSKVVSSFGVTGIPTKFIIDKNGNIRFTYIGYTGTPEKLVEEVADMIDMAANPDAVASNAAPGISKAGAVNK